MSRTHGPGLKAELRVNKTGLNDVKSRLGSKKSKGKIFIFQEFKNIKFNKVISRTEGIIEIEQAKINEKN